MQPRPLLAYTLSTIRSRYFSQWSTSSSPSRIFEKPGPCACTFGVAAIAIDRRRAAEDERALAVIEHGRPDVAAAGINRDRFARDARLKERFGHAVRRPRLLRAGLEHEPDLHRDDRQPERMHAGRVRRQHEAEHGALRLEADRHAALFAVARREHVEREPARQRRRGCGASRRARSRSSSCSRGTCARAGRCWPTAPWRTRPAIACRRPSAAWRSCRARPPRRRVRSDRRSGFRAALRARGAPCACRGRSARRWPG